MDLPLSYSLHLPHISHAGARTARADRRAVVDGGACLPRPRDDAPPGLHLAFLVPCISRASPSLSHVRVALSHQWVYELDHGADLHATCAVLAPREDKRAYSHNAGTAAERVAAGASRQSRYRQSQNQPPPSSKPRKIRYTILSWMRRRLADQQHSRAGHRAVHKLLVERGAKEDEPFRPVEVVRDADDERRSDADSEEEATVWTTDEEEMMCGALSIA